MLAVFIPLLASLGYKANSLENEIATIKEGQQGNEGQEEKEEGEKEGEIEFDGSRTSFESTFVSPEFSEFHSKYRVMDITGPIIDRVVLDYARNVSYVEEQDGLEENTIELIAEDDSSDEYIEQINVKGRASINRYCYLGSKDFVIKDFLGYFDTFTYDNELETASYSSSNEVNLTATVMKGGYVLTGRFVAPNGDLYTIENHFEFI